MSKVLVTGSNGFIAQSLIPYLYDKDHEIIYTYRQLPEEISSALKEHFAVGNIDAQTQWQSALNGVDVVVHLAARVHVMQETNADPLSAFRAVNTEGTLNLARQAVASGVKRFIYLSSIKVNGEQTIHQAFSAADEPDPQDPYAISKYEAEQQLLTLSKESGLDVVIIRPPLVYGRGVKGNFERLIKLLKKSIPLPLAQIDNARSLVSIENLNSLIQLCLTHPRAAGEVFLVSDGRDLSSSELFALIADALGKKSRLFYLPKGFIQFITHLLHRDAEFERLFSSLQVDITKNKQLLNWEPTISVEKGIKNACRDAACNVSG